MSTELVMDDFVKLLTGPNKIPTEVIGKVVRISKRRIAVRMWNKPYKIHFFNPYKLIKVEPEDLL